MELTDVLIVTEQSEWMNFPVSYLITKDDFINNFTEIYKSSNSSFTQEIMKAGMVIGDLASTSCYEYSDEDIDLSMHPCRNGRAQLWDVYKNYYQCKSFDKKPVFKMEYCSDKCKELIRELFKIDEEDEPKNDTFVYENEKYSILHSLPLKNTIFQIKELPDDDVVIFVAAKGAK